MADVVDRVLAIPYPADRILDDREVRELTKLCRATLWRMEKRGEFPKRVQMGPRRIGWKLSDIERWIAEL